MTAREPLRQIEARRQTEASTSVPALIVADAMTEFLADTMDRVDAPPAPDDAPPEYWQRAALVSLYVLAFRASRACIVLVTAGYVPEALGPLRIVAEAIARARWFAEDATAQRANNWLTEAQTAQSTPRKIASSAGRLEDFDAYSVSTHTDIRATQRFHGQMKDDRLAMNLAPAHDPPFANAVLAALIVDCHALAEHIAMEWKIPLDLPPDLAVDMIVSRNNWENAPLLAEYGPNPYVV